MTIRAGRRVLTDVRVRVSLWASIGFNGITLSHYNCVLPHVLSLRASRMDSENQSDNGFDPKALRYLLSFLGYACPLLYQTRTPIRIDACRTCIDSGSASY